MAEGDCLKAQFTLRREGGANGAETIALTARCSRSRDLTMIHISDLLLIAIGIVIGWNWQQPAWARSIQDKVVSSIRSAFSKGSKKDEPTDS